MAAASRDLCTVFPSPTVKSLVGKFQYRRCSRHPQPIRSNMMNFSTPRELSTLGHSHSSGIDKIELICDIGRDHIELGYWERSRVVGLKTKRAGGAMEEDPAVMTRAGRVVVPSTRAREALEGADSTDATAATRRTTSKVKLTAVRKATNQIEERQCAQDKNQAILRKMFQYLKGTYQEIKILKEMLNK
ncbi:hypothetical protein TSTA_083210 [Talaromyces stipitatus ATCC 10500]|uniref:Uncharacterized protein n=1 Tax=Talaromyces stipitatus (strain ATCC 10500 / CBS 375.48 / QM 6759 / NRRL 1006) TaxID=441959 RepID=B8LZ44_TALSN|nr:uncharacterized protein TSTA_083210 [Talaromyces stipitatus ATCC 10500]EED21088.1 hypothetical protein TSTA_083210 [Talaromyces stipitatus ATCC 10500]